MQRFKWERKREVKEEENVKKRHREDRQWRSRWRGEKNSDRNYKERKREEGGSV